jgi:hypothetical protein
MITFCNECGRYQGHETTCSQSEQVTIDDLSHENSLIRARNERLEAEKVELVESLTSLLRHFTQTPSTYADTNARCEAHAVLNKHTGSAT